MILAKTPKKQNISHQWRTSIQKGIKGAEKRSALFTWPRISLETEYFFSTQADYMWLKRNLYKYISSIWEIPIWYDKTTLISEAASGQKVLSVGATEHRHFYVGRDVVLICGGLSESATITTIDSSTQITVEDNLTLTWPIGTAVLPLYEFRIENIQEMKRKAILNYGISILAKEAFESTRDFSYSLPSSGLATYLDHDLFLTSPLAKNASLSYKHPYDLLQFLGIGLGHSHYDETEIGMKLGFNFSTKKTSQEFMNLFDSKMGRFGTFWIPTWSKDIIVTAAIEATDTILTIVDIKYNAFYFTNDIINRHLWIRFPDKSYVCRKIVAVPSSTHIVLDTAIDTAVAEDDLKDMLISFLVFSRFGADEIEAKHTTPNLVSVNINTQGLVEEAL